MSALDKLKRVNRRKANAVIRRADRDDEDEDVETLARRELRKLQR